MRFVGCGESAGGGAAWHGQLAAAGRTGALIARHAVFEVGSSNYLIKDAM